MQSLSAVSRFVVIVVKIIANGSFSANSNRKYENGTLVSSISSILTKLAGEVRVHSRNVFTKPFYEMCDHY